MLTTRPSLLQRMQSKQDTVSWSRFVELYTPLVHRWVSDLGVNEPSNNDVVQDVFMVLLGKMSNFKYDANQSFRGWLRTITINKCRDFWRRKNRNVEPQFLERIELAAADETNLLTEKEYHEYVASSALRMMKTHFSESTWRACWEHVANSRTAADVADELGISENAVYLARGRVLRRLRQELDGLWD